MPRPFTSRWTMAFMNRLRLVVRRMKTAIIETILRRHFNAVNLLELGFRKEPR